MGTATAASATHTVPRGLEFHQIHKNARTSHHGQRILHQKLPSTMAPHAPFPSIPETSEQGKLPQLPRDPQPRHK